MAGSVNKVILLGNLCADVDVRSFQNGGLTQPAKSGISAPKQGERCASERTTVHKIHEVV